WAKSIGSRATCVSSQRSRCGDGRCVRASMSRLGRVSSCRSAFPRDPQHDVEFRRQLADLRVLELGELDGERVALLALAQLAVDAVPGVAGLALDVALRGE